MNVSYELFIIVPPGLEDLALKEIELKCPIKIVSLTKGGIELNADLDWIVKSHTLLKIPTRILMRLTTFKVRDFPKLFQKFSTFKWNKYLSHPEPKWEISCSKSRLNHTGRIEETVNKALKEAIRKQPLGLDWVHKNFSPQTYYIRLFNDELTLSLDLSGDALYKRGFQKIKGEAPLRENFAAAFAFEILNDVDSPVQLIDPMCGSATFLTEARLFYTPLHLRKFSFEEAPFFKGKVIKLAPLFGEFNLKEVIGFDIEHELLEKVKKEIGTQLKIDLKKSNSLENKIATNESIIICNPPYGERIKIDGKRGSFLKQAWLKFLNIDQPYRFGWVIPSDMDDLFSNPIGYHLKTKRHLKNGGLPVTFWIWEKSPIDD
jgi:putative N6-adenine-specific DNA methylase